jgi:DNA polymerase alpha subunit B
MFSLNETLFAVTTNDILFHLKCEEITQNAGSDPFARLSTHLLTQRSFYPLFPPPPRESLPAGLSAVGASLDVPNMRLADLVNVTPDVLVVPSMLGTFAKVVDGVVVVNPGNASKPRGAGTFVELVILPKRVEEEKMDGSVGHEVWSRARVDIMRI